MGVFFINLNWLFWLPSISKVDPKYLDGMSELFIFMSLFSLSSDDFIVIDGILLLFVMMGVFSSVKFHDMMYALHLSISSLPLDMNRRCSHV